MSSDPSKYAVSEPVAEKKTGDNGAEAREKAATKAAAQKAKSEATGRQVVISSFLAIFICVCGIILAMALIKYTPREYEWTALVAMLQI